MLCPHRTMLSAVSIKESINIYNHDKNQPDLDKLITNQINPAKEVMYIIPSRVSSRVIFAVSRKQTSAQCYGGVRLSTKGSI